MKGTQLLEQSPTVIPVSTTVCLPLSQQMEPHAPYFPLKQTASVPFSHKTQFLFVSFNKIPRVRPILHISDINVNGND